MKPIIHNLVSSLVFVTDVVYKNRPYPRFWVLETIARVPYFAYLSVLHFYETLGYWRKSDWLKVHFSEI
jgi:ubiquinol oxidase